MKGPTTYVLERDEALILPLFLVMPGVWQASTLGIYAMQITARLH